MDHSSRPTFPPSLPSESAAQPQRGERRLTPRQAAVLIDLAKLAGIVALIVWLSHTADALRRAAPLPPEPLPFKVVARQFGRVQVGASREEVERLLGSPTEGHARGPEVEEFELRWWNGGRNFFPEDREWNRWSDQADPGRWVAVVYTRRSERQTVYGKLKKGV